MDPPHSDVSSGSILIPVDFSQFLFWKNTIHVTVFSGLPPPRLGGRVRPLSSPVRRTIFWSVTTRGLPEIAEPIVDLVSRGVSVVGIAAREGRDGKRGVARKWQRNGLKRLNPRPEMVWSRKPRTHKMWYAGALTVRDSADEPRRATKLQKKAPKVLQSLDAELKSALAFPASNDVRDFRTKSGEAEGDGHRKGRG